MTSIYIETLGCAKNRVDSEIMLGTLLNNSFTYAKAVEDANVIILNTCGFLTEAVNEGINRILELAEYKQQGSCEKLIVAGCMSERYRDSLLEEIPEVDGLVGTSDYSEILSVVRNALERDERRSYLLKKPKYNAESLNNDRVLSTQPHYAYLKIAEGCSNMCSFCNIPKLRGLFQSRGIQSINQDFQKLLQKGVKEINLISQDSSSYGIDRKDDANLLRLVQTLLENEQQDFWLRTFYSYPNRYPKELFQLMKQDQRLVNYIDMPFQHIADPVLKKMNRKITRKEIEGLMESAFATVPDLSFRTTFIVGFPNETEKDFQELLSFVQKGYFEHIGVFSYSHEDNIASNVMGDLVPDEVKEERRAVLMEAQKQILEKKNQSRIGKTYQVLVEGLSSESDLLLQGRTQYQGIDVDGVVLINEGEAVAGQFHPVTITEAHPYDLIGAIQS
ncbi:MAG: ribosomal protein S12 methylthiotransferase [bacterium]|jgi:ribosomal protein S12 methylthiotransferase